MCREFELDLVFNREWDKFSNLTMAIKENYKSNPFHNWYHAFSVAHMATIFMVRNPFLAKNLGQRFHLGFIIAALGHDLNHPGNDNFFELNTESTLARHYHHEIYFGKLSCRDVAEIITRRRQECFLVMQHDPSRRNP